MSLVVLNKTISIVELILYLYVKWSPLNLKVIEEETSEQW